MQLLLAFSPFSISSCPMLYRLYSRSSSRYSLYVKIKFNVGRRWRKFCYTRSQANLFACIYKNVALNEEKKREIRSDMMRGHAARERGGKMLYGKKIMLNFISIRVYRVCTLFFCEENHFVCFLIINKLNVYSLPHSCFFRSYWLFSKKY